MRATPTKPTISPIHILFVYCTLHLYLEEKLAWCALARARVPLGLWTRRRVCHSRFVSLLLPYILFAVAVATSYGPLALALFIFPMTSITHRRACLLEPSRSFAIDIPIIGLTPAQLRHEPSLCSQVPSLLVALAAARRQRKHETPSSPASERCTRATTK